MDIGVYKVAMNAPSDVSELERLIAAGTIDPRSIVALIGKTEGNGGANDFTRGFATLSYQLLLARYLGCSPEEVGTRIAFVWSGGCEGVLSPHATVFTHQPGNGVGEAEGRLALGIEVTRDILPEEVGTMVQVEEVAAAVRRCLVAAGIENPADVHYVQVKGPLLTPGSIADADKRGKGLVTRDPNGSKAYARGATALGVALGLGEIAAAELTDAMIATRFDLFSSVASTSAGGELKACEVLLFGNSPKASGGFRIGHAVLADAIDADGVRAALLDAGLDFSCNPSREDATRIAAVFAKAEASPTGSIRGRRNTMLSDADINYERHARAALGAVIASITGDPAIFVSGGTEHQCAPGAAPIAAIVRV
ncbi:ring-opening amidohydrolase [Lichenihabitans sp. PAMC28606]|uniref:cyanuric acid amidohydrolase n=1 Tax=Lichenihabitans sp. PAMC28606 TaxID=2880932 RepID=UPI001D0A7B4F|nr:ring-opening amidohydrolase [Lichenihabitans sp. PAMC28606]UDL95992.1 ring-opening amidohydrolase [Lichenihabitans sp. PAMC28606]